MENDIIDPKNLSTEELKRDWIDWMWCPHISLNINPTIDILIKAMKDLYNFKLHYVVTNGDQPWSVMESNKTVYFLIKKEASGFMKEIMSKGNCIHIDL